MPDLEFGWFMPTRGDTDDYSVPLKVSTGLEMFDRVAIAAEQAGFERKAPASPAFRHGEG
jgi:alkanesulfonate monooxygenase